LISEAAKVNLRIGKYVNCIVLIGLDARKCRVTVTGQAAITSASVAKIKYQRNHFKHSYFKNCFHKSVKNAIT